MINEDFSQPFCTIGSKGKFRPGSPSHLPPLEDKRMDLPERLEELEKQMSSLTKPNLTAKQNDTINQIKSGYIHLQRKVNELTAKKKQPDKYIIK